MARLSSSLWLPEVRPACFRCWLWRGARKSERASGVERSCSLAGAGSARGLLGRFCLQDVRRAAQPLSDRLAPWGQPVREQIHPAEQAPHPRADHQPVSGASRQPQRSSGLAGLGFTSIKPAPSPQGRTPFPAIAPLQTGVR